MGSLKKHVRYKANQKKKQEAATAGDMEIAVTRVFDNLKVANNKIISNRGGARSSKSYSIGQLLTERFLTVPRRQILIVRKTLPSLRKSCLRLIQYLLESYGVWDKVHFEKQPLNMWYKGALIHFSSVDDPEKIKSTEWNDIWMEEATEFNYEDFVNLDLRLSAPTQGMTGLRNQMILSFNPIDELHWIKQKLYDTGLYDLLDIHSTYRDNPFLSQDYVERIEALKIQDPNYYNIFAEGIWGKLEHVIYKNWVLTNEIYEGETIYGIDFGFNKPSSIVQVTTEGMDAFIRQRFYAVGKTNAEMISALNDIVPEYKRKSYKIYADAAEPNRIAEIYSAGFNILPANKSVNDGIDTVKRFKLHIFEESDDLIKEIRGYSYKVDKDGNVYDEPIKFNDHCMDALRYAIHTHFANKFLTRKAEIKVTDIDEYLAMKAALGQIPVVPGDDIIRLPVPDKTYIPQLPAN